MFRLLSPLEGFFSYLTIELSLLFNFGRDELKFSVPWFWEFAELLPLYLLANSNKQGRQRWLKKDCFASYWIYLKLGGKEEKIKEFYRWLCENHAELYERLEKYEWEYVKNKLIYRYKNNGLVQTSLELLQTDPAKAYLKIRERFGTLPNLILNSLAEGYNVQELSELRKMMILLSQFNPRRFKNFGE